MLRKTALLASLLALGTVAVQAQQPAPRTAPQAIAAPDSVHVDSAKAAPIAQVAHRSLLRRIAEKSGVLAIKGTAATLNGVAALANHTRDQVDASACTDLPLSGQCEAYIKREVDKLATAPRPPDP